MKKLLILAFALAPALAYAQPETASVTVSTTIRDAFELTKVDDLVFGNVQAGDNVSITATTNALLGAGSTGKRAVITSNAASATVYTISGLGYAAGVIDLPYVSGGGVSPATEIEVTLNFAVDSASPVSYTPGTTTGASNTAGNTLYIGGSFTAPSGDSVGALYSGAITVTAVYL